MKGPTRLAEQRIVNYDLNGGVFAVTLTASEQELVPTWFGHPFATDALRHKCGAQKTHHPEGH